MRISRTSSLPSLAASSLLMLVGIGVALWTLDLNQFVGPVLASIKAVTGREVTVGGDVELPHRLYAQGRGPRRAPRERAVGARRRTSSRPRSSSCTWHCCRSCGANSSSCGSISSSPSSRSKRTRTAGATGSSEPAAASAAAPPAVDARPGAFAAGDLRRHRRRAHLWRRCRRCAYTRDDRQILVAGARPAIAGGCRVSRRGRRRARRPHGQARTVRDALRARKPYPVSLQGELAGRRSLGRRQDPARRQARRAAGHRRRVRIERRQGNDRDPRRRSQVHVDGEPALDGAQARRSAGCRSHRRPVRGKPAVKAAAGGAGRRNTYSPMRRCRSMPCARAMRTARSRSSGSRSPAIERSIAVHAKFSLRNGKLEMPAAQVSAYGGTITGSVDDRCHARKGTCHCGAGGGPRARSRGAAGGGGRLARSARRQDECRHRRHDARRLAAQVDEWHQRPRAGGGRARRRSSTPSSTPPSRSIELAEALNPFRKVNPSTELQCAVVRLPLAGGVAQRRPLDRLRNEGDRRLDERHARLPQRDARPVDSAAGPAGDPHRDSADRGAGAISRARCVAIRYRRRHGVGIGDRADRRGHRHGRTVGAGRNPLRAGRREWRRVRSGARQGSVGGAPAQPRRPAKSGAGSPSNPIEGIGNALKGLFQR